MKERHSETVQLRLTPRQKRQLKDDARSHGLEMSEYIRSRLFSSLGDEFRTFILELEAGTHRRETLAEFNSFLSNLRPEDFGEALASLPQNRLNDLDANYIAAMVEVAAKQKGVAFPSWTRQIKKLPKPYFSSDLQSLRLHLLVSSPPPFCARNIFIDATVGARI